MSVEKKERSAETMKCKASFGRLINGLITRNADITRDPHEGYKEIALCLLKANWISLVKNHWQLLISVNL